MASQSKQLDKDFAKALKQGLITAMEEEMKMLEERRLRLQRKLDKVVARMNRVRVQLVVEKEF